MVQNFFPTLSTSDSKPNITAVKDINITDWKKFYRSMAMDREELIVKVGFYKSKYCSMRLFIN